MPKYTEDQHTSAVAVYNLLLVNHRLTEQGQKTFLNTLWAFEEAITEGEDFPAFLHLYYDLKGHIDQLKRLVTKMDGELAEMHTPVTSEE